MDQHILVIANHHETYCLAALVLWTLLTIALGFMTGVFNIRPKNS